MPWRDGDGRGPLRVTSEAELRFHVNQVSGEGNRVAYERLLRKGRHGTMPGCDCCYSLLQVGVVRGVGRLCVACQQGQCPKATCVLCPKCGAWCVNAPKRQEHIRDAHPRLWEKLLAKTRPPVKAAEEEAGQA